MGFTGVRFFAGVVGGEEEDGDVASLAVGVIPAPRALK